MASAKQRKTAETCYSLHVCSNVEPAGVSVVAADRRNRKKKQIWNSEQEFPVSDGIELQSFDFLDPATEYSRMNCVQILNKQFTKMVKHQTNRVPPIMAFERWLCRSKHFEFTTEPETHDPVLPCSCKTDPSLVEDLVRGSITTEDAEQISLQLAKESKDLVVDVILNTKKKKKNNFNITVSKHKHTIDICYGKKLLKVNYPHYEKLKIQFFRYGVVNSESKKSGETKENMDLFHKALFIVLARYHGIQGYGYQAACGENVFDVLSKYFGVTMECFGSPLNSYYNHYCSAFVDSDWCFGAVSNFFQFNPLEGSFECNPPFVPAIMMDTVKHVHKLLEASQPEESRPLTFVVVVPGWLDDAAIQALENSKWKTEKYEISKEEHGFCDGAQHQRKDRFRESPFDTFIFILQNKAGNLKFPPSTEAEDAVRSAMATAIPTDAMKLRRLKEGRGFGGADGSGGVYKGKKKNRKPKPPNSYFPPTKKQKL